MSLPPNGLQHLLIFEPDSRGHAAEWIEHLLRAVHRQRSVSQITLAVPVTLADEILGNGAEPWRSYTCVLPLRRTEIALCNSRFLPASGFARWWVMRRGLKRTRADHGLFLGIDHLTLPLGMGLGFGDRQVSGVLFRPSIHYKHEANRPPSLFERVRDLRKTLLYRLTLRNPAVRSLRSLDPYFPAYAAMRFPYSEKIQSVPDPAHPFVPNGETDDMDDAPQSERPPPGRVLFVIFGVLSERKGVLTLIEALRRLESRYTSAIAVYAAGEVDPGIRRRLQVMISELAEVRPELWWKLENRRLTTANIAALVHRADVVLAPYQRFVGSSGVLLWAAKVGKPVITQDYGLLGRLVREYGLGLATDTSDPSALAAAIAAAVRHGPQTLGDADGMTRFIASRTPESFAASILEGVHGTSHFRSPVAFQRTANADATD
jgi:glycosyltransferase involved in cell wall biosynthesis